MLTYICTQPLGQRSGPAPSHGALWPNPLFSAAHIPEPIPSMYTRHAAWTKDVTVEMVSCLFKAASSPIVFMKLTQDRISRILTTHLEKQPHSTHSELLLLFEEKHSHHCFISCMIKKTDILCKF